MALLSPTYLETMTYGQPNWHSILNKNFQIVNWYLTKLERMQDVSATIKEDNCTLAYNSTRQQYCSARIVRL
jgi:hypothetical protein